MKKTHFGIEYYFKPTPKWARLIGDALLYGGTVATGLAASNGDMKLAGATLAMSVTGKFFSNWATETEKDTKDGQPNGQ